jgi:hypothetical protein
MVDRFTTFTGLRLAVTSAKHWGFCFGGVVVKIVVPVLFSLSSAVLFPLSASAGQQAGAASLPAAVSADARAFEQNNVPAGAQQAEDTVERAVRRYRIGIEGGVGVDPELIMFGAHGAFGPVFKRNVQFRPGVEFGVGELTTLFGINLDVLYTLGTMRGAGWTPYIGAGPNFALSHRGFEVDDDETDDNERNRFDFSDTDFEGGVNFIAGARRSNGMFLEMKATAYGVSNVRLLVGFNF